MMATDVLIVEVSVEHQSKGDATEELVDTLTVVDHLVPGQATHCSDESYGDDKEEILEISFWLSLENPVVWLVVGAEEHAVIDPACELGEDICVQRNLELPVGNEFLLILFLNVGAVIEQELIINTTTNICDPEDDQYITGIHKYDMGQDQHDPWLERRQHISDKCWFHFGRVGDDFDISIHYVFVCHFFLHFHLNILIHWRVSVCLFVWHMYYI